VVGLAVARALARAGREVVVLERETSPGQHASSRNSEVVHAGLYYPAGSLKARLCVEGRQRLYRFCGAHGVGIRAVGKLVVATEPAHDPILAHLRARAQANGVDDLRPLSGADVQAMEPRLRVRSGLWSPSTGIVDGHGLMAALGADAQAHGATVVTHSPFMRARPSIDGLDVEAGDARVRCRVLVNAAGLWATEVAAAIEGMPPGAVPRASLCKGSYFSLAGPAPFSHLVYPVPDTASLGIHVTLDLAGGVRLGPDQQWVDAIDYAVDPARASAFAAAARDYYPGLDAETLRPDYAGIRAKLHRPGQPAPDFVVQGPAEHGIDGLCSLLGIESPGLTSCLALADHVLRVLGIEPAPER